MINKKILLVFCIFLLSLISVSAIDWSPQGNISLKDRYYILNNPADQCNLGEIPLGTNADGSLNCTNSSSYLDVNSTTWWADVSSWLSGWFFKSGSSLAFNESKFNDSVRNIDNLSDKNLDNISYSKFINVPAACPDGYAVTNLSYPATCVQFSTIDDNRSWNESYANGLYSGIEWDYNQSLATYNLWNDIWSSTYNVTYDKWSYNMSTSGGNFSWNESYADTLYAEIKWSYNQTYSGSTYNATYDKWNYNQSLWTNVSGTATYYGNVESMKNITAISYETNGEQVLYYPNQTRFEGTLIIGNGGNSLTHTGGQEGFYNTFIGGGVGDLVTTGMGNAGIGYSSLAMLTTGNGNLALGRQSLRGVTTSDNNVGIGYRTGYAMGGGANSNVVIGSESGYNLNKTGNIGIGSSTLRLAQNAQYNTALGYQSMYSLRTGNYNIGIGSLSLKSNEDGNYNVGIGFNSLTSASGHNPKENTAIGSYSGTLIEEGERNSILGYYAGYNIKNGSRNIIIGEGVDVDDPNGDYQLNIGDIIKGVTDGATAGVILESQSATGVPLSVEGAPAQSANLQEWQDSTGNILSVIDKDGKVGIGTSTPTHKLEVNGTMKVYENITMVSPDGTEWNCGVNDSGTFSCS